MDVEARPGSPRGSSPASESGSLPPVGAIPMSSVSGRGSQGERLASVATIGMSWSGRIDETLPPAWVESMTATTSSGP